eukprot:4451316-Alexandrium_andersonii.AAC.1
MHTLELGGAGPRVVGPCELALLGVVAPATGLQAPLDHQRMLAELRHGPRAPRDGGRDDHRDAD